MLRMLVLLLAMSQAALARTAEEHTAPLTSMSEAELAAFRWRGTAARERREPAKVLLLVPTNPPRRPSSAGKIVGKPGELSDAMLGAVRWNLVPRPGMENTP